MAAESKSTTKSKKTARSKSSASAAAFRREASGLLLILLALSILLALVSFDIGDLDATKPQNLIGPVGVELGGALLFMFGIASFCLDALLWYLGICMVLGKSVEWKPAQIAGQFVFVIAGAILFHLALEEYILFGHIPGGLTGEVLGEILRGFVGTVGAYLVGTGLLLLSLMLSTRMSLGGMARKIIALFHRSVAWTRHKARVHREYRAALQAERQKLKEGDLSSLEEEARAEAELEATPIVPGEGYEFEENLDKEVEKKLSNRLKKIAKTAVKERREQAKDVTVAGKAVEVADDSVMDKVSVEIERDSGWELGDITGKNEVVEPESVEEQYVEDESVEEDETGDTDVIDMKKEKNATSSVDVDFGPQIVDNAKMKRAERAEALEGDGPLFKPQKKGNYELPSLQFLNFERNDEPAVDPEELRSMAAQIEQTLKDFRVDGQIVEICPGPVITMFEFSPAPGVKISKIANLSDDLAMALAAHSVRIVAPIPGKGVVGIEVPNPTREMVFLKEIIADETFQKSKMELPLTLGFDVEGEPVVADLARMPHLLVAGATGSGKSVAVNTMICSLLYRHTADDVKMIMVDPKMLEFSIYADIPHLLLPVVTDPKQATVALNWAVQEMERRYQALADMGVRNVSGYNSKVDRLMKQAELDQLDGKDDSEAMRQLGIDASGDPEHKRLPYLVVIIDEFADLMMTAAKDVETAVARLAQKARAAGIHLILATQRPSTDVITGLIKANFPTRVALRVTSKTDSRVILDSNGAENLLGNGDMLFVPPGSSNLQRVHGAYVSEKEIDKVVGFLREQAEPEYDESILVEEDEDGGGYIEDMEKDEHYEDAVNIVVDSGQASISMIQRKLRVGYNRAARMVDMMEAEGLVSEADGYKPREVLIDESPF